MKSENEKLELNMKPKSNLFVLEDAMVALAEAKEAIKVAQEHARKMSIAVDAAKKREKSNG